MTPLNEIVNTAVWRIDDEQVQLACREQLNADGVVVLPNFLTDASVPQ